jgi:Mrp family chromosome partitioning ATPase
MPDSSAASAVRFIATKIAYADPDRPTTSVLVLGTASRDGAADLALGVATSLARAGRSVVLVDANNETRDLTRLIGADRFGLAELLTQDAQLEDVVLERARWPAIVPAGGTTAMQLLDLDVARSLLRRLGERYDVTVLAGAPLHVSGNTLVWARAVSGVVVAAERDRARRDDVTFAMENLAAVKASVIGTVLLDHAPRPRRSGASDRDRDTSTHSLPAPRARRPSAERSVNVTDAKPRQAAETVRPDA